MRKISDIIKDFKTKPKIDKIFLIKELEAFDDKEAYYFLCNIIKNEDEEDFVRIETLKSLTYKDIELNKNREVIAISIIKTLDLTSDDDVKNYCVIALRNFLTNSTALNTLKEICLNINADTDLRHNSIDSICTIDDRKQLLPILKKISNLNDEIGSIAKEEIEKYSSPP